MCVVVYTDGEVECCFLQELRQEREVAGSTSSQNAHYSEI